MSTLRIYGLCVFLSCLFAVSTPASAAYLAADPADFKCCACQNNPCSAASSCGCQISLSEGNLKEGYGPVATLQSTNGPTVTLSLTYNSYNADGSRAQLNTVVGYGWTHSYNLFLFTQRGSMFRMDEAGRVTKFQPVSSTRFLPTAGNFETLIKNPDNSFTLTRKDGTVFRFAQVPGSTFLVEGPVWLLQSLTDRNGNMTTLTYVSGKLDTITDTYGRSLKLAYNGNMLASVTDPLHRVTTFAYTNNGTQLSTITDPLGKTVQYSYNFLNQITQKTDRDGRVFQYLYQNTLPVAVVDGAGNPLFQLANPSNWATNPTARAVSLLRIYTPSTTTKTDGLGNAWTYSYDANGYIGQATAPDGATTQYQ